MLCWNVSFHSCLLAVRILVSQTGHLTRATMTPDSLLVTSLKGCRNVGYQTRPFLAPPFGGQRRVLLSWNVSFHYCLLVVRILVSQTGHLTRATMTPDSLLVTSLKGYRNLGYHTRPVLRPVVAVDDALCLVGTSAFILVSWPFGFWSRRLVISRGRR